MVKVEFEEKQFEYLFKLLDNELKINGLRSLGDVVDLHNVLMRSKQEETEKSGLDGNSSPTPEKGV